MPWILFLLVLTLSSCQEEKRRPVYVSYNDYSETSYARSGDETVIPFRTENGVKYVQVKVNGVVLEMIFDTGCSSTLISLAEANYLYQKGLLKLQDILGVTQSMIADGSVVEDMEVNLREVIIADRILCRDVRAVVSSNVNAPLLLGNEVLDRLATIKIDNENKTLIFRLK